MDKDKKDFDPADLLGGTLNILGLKIDVGELLTSPQDLRDRLEELRAKLKAAGGTEVLSDEEWNRGGASITGHIRIRGISGDQEYHIGTSGKARPARTPTAEPPEAVEPTVDVFDEGDGVTVIADVPGISLDDLELKVEGSRFFLSTRPTARRRFRKELHLETELEPTSLQATCNNGVLEVRLRKRVGGDG